MADINKIVDRASLALFIIQSIASFTTLERSSIVGLLSGKGKLAKSKRDEVIKIAQVATRRSMAKTRKIEKEQMGTLAAPN